MLVGAVTVVGRDVVPGGGRLDVPGAVLATGGLFSLVYAISTGADAGWTSLPTSGSLAAAVILLGVVTRLRRPA